MRSICLLLACIVVGGLEHHCGVTAAWEKQLAEEAESARRLQAVPAFRRSASLGPLRLRAYYVNMTALGPTTTAHIQDVTMPGVLKWYNNMLSVYNLQENWKMPQISCTSIVTVPADHVSPGIADIDLMIYITSISSSNNNYIAKGGYCVLDGSLYQNPMAGLLLINAAYYTGLSPEMEISILRHEIAHILGFSSSLFPKYRQADGSLYPAPMVNLMLRDSNVTMLTTPTVVARARATYGCDTLIGMELENYGGVGTASSHWEKRSLVNDFMVGTLTLDMIYSDITLAALEDSGWYKVNYDYTDPVQFGRGEGCDFFNKKCVINGVAQFPEFCSTAGQSVCSFSNTRKASCNMGNLTVATSPAYQYFANPLTAGYDFSADNCPFREPYADGDCKNRSSLASFYQPLLFGEQLCDTCMCFTGTYILPNRAIANPIHYGCHNVTCENGIAKVRVGNGTITCPAAGGQVTGITGYNGYINCPPYEKLCGNRPCINGCFGYGKCVLGNCQCNDGYSAIDCSLVCHETCRKCTGTLAENCESCYPNAHLSSRSCICDDGFAYNSTSQRCEPCHISCKTCSGLTSVQCSTCVVNAALATTGECLCNSGFTRSDDGQTCVACFATCLTCIGTLSTSCSACKPNASLPASQPLGSCTCNSGFFLRPDSTCGACHATCKECSAGAATACTACKPDTAGVKDGACVCSGSFYLTTDGNQCLACSATCKTCSGPAASSCLSCKPLTATVTSGACTCPLGFYLSADGSLCAACDASCKGCAGAALCTSCKPNNAVLSGGVCGCPAGYYMTSDAALCPACDSNCVTCSLPGLSGCMSCYPLAILTPTPGPGTCSCAERYYYSIPDGCLPCHYSCKTCSGSLATNCLSCQSGTPSNGKCTCASGLFMSQSSYCQSCSPNCLTCASTAVQCLTCDESVSTLSSDHCTCLPSAFLSASAACVACHSTCLTCSAETDSACLSCVPHATLAAGKCGCDPGFARSGDLTACPACHFSCRTCTGLTDSDCDSCKGTAALQPGGQCACSPKFFMKSDGTCEQCHPQCATCSGPAANQCFSCLSNATLQSGNSCACNPGYYLAADSTCEACHAQCATCFGPDNNTCLSCRSTATVQSDVCVCPSHQYLALDGQKCLECDVACQACAAPGPNSCTACYLLGVLVPSPGPGTCSCPNGLTYVPSIGCQPCHITCKECLGTAANQCTECQLGAKIDGSTPNSCSCEEGYFPNAVGICTVCAPNCRSCVESASRCVACDPLVASLSDNVCVCLSTAFKSASGLCLPCDESCVTCSSASSSGCLSCASHTFLTSTPGACLCLSSFFPNPTVQNCVPCDQSCRECFAADGASCTACFTPAFLSPSGSCQCPDGYFPHGSSANCQLCSELCATCSGPGETDCSGCLMDAKLVSAPPSLCVCRDGFFPSPDQAHCAACDQSCGTCTELSPFFCLTCAPGFTRVSGLYCLRVCPTGQTSLDGSCATSGSDPSFRVQFDKVSQTVVDSATHAVAQSGSNPANDANDPTAYYQQGWLFDGTSDYVLIPPNTIDRRNVVLDSTHVVEMWVRPAPGTAFSCLLSKTYVQSPTVKTLLRLCITEVSKLQLDLSLLDLGGSTAVSTKTLLGGVVSRSNMWTSISYRVVLKSKSGTKVALQINQVTVASAAYTGLAFVDSVGDDESVKFVVGAGHAAGTGFQYFYKGSVAELTFFNWDAALAPFPGCACAACSSGGVCLSLCMETEFFNATSVACQSCLPACTLGCIRGTDCRVNTDPLCGSFSTFVGCDVCSDLSAPGPAGCECIPNAVLTSGKCECVPEYPRSGSQCGECRNYIDSSQVVAYFDASYLMIVLEFAKPMVSTAAPTCDFLFDVATLSKMGQGAECVWASDESSVTVVLGTGTSVGNEVLGLRAINLYARNGTCTITAVALGPVAAFKYPLPTPTAVLSLPSVFSIPCSTVDTLDLDGSASYGGKGRPLNFTWTVQSDPPSSALSRYQNYVTANSVLAVPKEILGSAMVTVTLTVKNFVGGVGATYGVVNVTSGEAISLKLDGGDNFTMKHPDSRLVAAHSSNLCTNSSLLFTWAFLYSSPPSPLLSTSFLPTLSPRNAITLPANTFKPGCSYTFQVNTTDGVYFGWLTFTATIVPSDLVADLDRVDSDVNAGTDYNVSGISSYDPDEAPGAMGYSWACLEAGKPCLDPSGNVAIVSETKVNLTIPGVRLRANSTWNITLTVTKDSRVAWKSVLIAIKANVSTLFINQFPTPARLNPQIKNQVALAISSLPNTTFMWTQQLGKTLSLLTPLTYPYLLIAGSAMDYGETYGFTLTATNAKGVSSAKIAFKANYSPRNGSSTISPASGLALKTIFEVRSTGWEDAEGDLPLSYSVFYLYKTTPIMLSSKSLSNYFAFKSGIGNYEFYTLIWDNMSTQTAAYLGIISVKLASRALQTTSVLASFLQDTIDKSLLFHMVRAYTTVYQFDNATFAGILSSVEAYVALIDPADDSQIDALIGALSALFLQKAQITAPVLERILALVDTMMGKATSGVKESRLKSLFWLVGEAQVEGREMEEMLQEFWQKYEALGVTGLMPDEQAITFSSTVRSSFYQRVSMRTLPSLTVAAGKTKVSLPSNLASTLSPDQVFDVHFDSAVYENATSEVVAIGLFEAGIFRDYSFEARSSPVEVVVTNLSIPVGIAVPIHRYVANTSYECQYEDFPGHWSNSGLSLTSLSPVLGNCSSTHLSSFRVEPKAMLTIPAPTDTAPLEAHCKVNPAPIVLSFSVLVLGLLLIAYLRTTEPVFRSLRISSQFSEYHQEADGMKNHLPTISTAIPTEEPIIIDYQRAFRPTFSRAMCETHGITGMWVHSTDLLRWSKMLVLTTAVEVDMCVVGWFYDRNEGIESHEAAYVWNSYGWGDGKAVVVALAVGLGCSAPLTALFSLARRGKSEMIETVLTIAASAFAIGLLLSAVSLTVQLALSLCFEEGGKWAIGTLCAFFGEVLLSQSILGLGRATIFQLMK